MRRMLIVVVGAILLSAQAAPPASDPVRDHYRAFRAAFAAHDLATADVEANAALQASLARDGQGGRTGVLAINLAQLRLAAQRNAEAYAPALQAMDIATHDSTSGVDVLLARLVLGRAELTPAHEREGRARLLAALPEVTPRTDLHADAYDAAAALGVWTFANAEFSDAITAWEDAEQFSHAAQIDPAYARAEALVAEGAARYSLAATRQLLERSRPTDTHINFDAAPQYQRAEAALVEAERLLRPFAHTLGEGDGLTLAQRTFGYAIAWRLVLRSYLTSTNQPVPRELAGGEDPERVSEAGAGACAMRVIAQPLPHFPPSAAGGYSVGAVVVRLRLNERGDVIDTRVAAAVPQHGFQAAVERVAPQWRVERDPTNAPNCQVQPIVFQSIQFVFP